MVNKVILLGNLTADPEVRKTPSGQTVANVRLATNERFKDRSGELQERTEFHRIVFWGRQAETIERYATKGKPLFVEGRIQTREYQDRDGNRRWATDVVARDFRFISGGRRDEERAPSRESASTGSANGGQDQGGGAWDQSAPATPPADNNNNADAGGDAWGAEDDLPF